MTDEQDAAIAAQAAELAAQLVELTERKDAAEKRVRELRAAENPRGGVFFAQEIFAAQQEKLTLETAMEIARRQRNRLLLPQ